ncbi:MAG: SUMF1/EgtB/PvdO family nonheme iron enzyme [Lewinellaceae bacterium]|nr:SUMF1/EgtB/PvdO family nonheme iron enzyme [Lewinellaceae bacterium]
MALTKPLETIRKDLHDQLVEDIASALKSLLALLPETTDKYVLVIALLGRLNDANKARLRNTLSNDDLQREYNKIRADFFDLVQGLQEADFEASTPQDAAGQAAPKQGSILYRIPDIMPMHQETKCVVRIAMDEDAIVENITIDEHVQLKELYRVSDTMQAELLDPSGGRVFRITTISEDIQLIDAHGYTEWWFYVTPLEAGTYPLILKIAIIEMVNGQPRSKELVLEQSVQIITGGPASDEGTKALKPAGYALAFQAASVAGAGIVTNITPPKSSAAASASPATAAASLGVLSKITLFVLALAAGSTAGWFAVPEVSRVWWKARYLTDTAAGYAHYMAEYPDGARYEEAACRKILLENKPEAYRDYLYEFPEGQCRAEAGQALEQLERAWLAELRKNPSETALRAYMIQFPECENLEGVLEVVLENKSLRGVYLPLLLQRWEECRLLFPTFPELPVVEEQQPVLPAPDTPAEPVPAQPARQTRPEQPTPAQPTIPVPDLVLIRGGTFPMGSTAGLEDEVPVRQVTLRDFYLGKTEVTFEEYDRFCAATGRNKPDDEGWGRGRRPVIHVSWADAAAYCNWLSAAHGQTAVYTFLPAGKVAVSRTANGYRLPTEAEWEYAARGGQNHAYSGSETLNEVAWYLENSGNQTHPVAHKTPNIWGLYDMTGNVREWCQDWYARYPASDGKDPLGPSSSKSRVLRGGQWGRNPLQQRISYRNSAKPDYHDYGTGFRLARWP